MSFQFVTIPKMPSICIPPWANSTATVMVGACDPGGRPLGLAPRSPRNEVGNTHLSKNTYHLSAGLSGAWAHWSRCRKPLAVHRAIEKTFASGRSVLSCMSKTPRQTFCAICGHTPSKPEGLLSTFHLCWAQQVCLQFSPLSPRCPPFFLPGSLPSF